jgi:hypothetical protein
MKREHEPMATKPATMKPVVHQKLELDLDDGATRVQKFPKELIHRLREQEKAKSAPPPQDDRTAVFRAPPELLARARELRNAHAAEEAMGVNDLPTKPPPAPMDDAIADSGVQYVSENASGISLRPAGLPGIPASTDVATAAPNLANLRDNEEWSYPESSIEDPTLIRSEALSLMDSLRVVPVADDSPVAPLVESDPVTEALLSTDVDALLAPVAGPPSSRRSGAASSAPELTVAQADELAVVRAPARRLFGRQLLIAAVLVAVAVAVLVRLGVLLH